MNHVIEVEHLSKEFLIRQPFRGFRGAIKSLFSNQKKKLSAIKDLSFTVNQAERVAFIGPNGAGKSTTIKMLTGILYPTSGSIKVLGLTPWKDRKALGYQIGTVFGQRTQLWYHLPPSDTFDLLAKIYELDSATYQKTLKKLVDVFEIGHLLSQPVRKLSLGERMRCELVASLLHSPKVLFLDEPTIGLDIEARLRIRKLLNELSKEAKTTLFLTSHDTADIEQVCERVIILDQGTIVLDQPLQNLKKNYLKTKRITFVTDQQELALDMEGVEVLENYNYHTVCEVDPAVIPIEKVIAKAMQLASLKDITIEDPSMEEIIQTLYQGNYG